jgi:hypothetical protein
VDHQNSLGHAPRQWLRADYMNCGGCTCRRGKVIGRGEHVVSAWGYGGMVDGSGLSCGLCSHLDFEPAKRAGGCGRRCRSWRVCRFRATNSGAVRFNYDPDHVGVLGHVSTGCDGQRCSWRDHRVGCGSQTEIRLSWLAAAAAAYERRQGTGEQRNSQTAMPQNLPRAKLENGHLRRILCRCPVAVNHVSGLRRFPAG